VCTDTAVVYNPNFMARAARRPFKGNAFIFMLLGCLRISAEPTVGLRFMRQRSASLDSALVGDDQGIQLRVRCVAGSSCCAQGMLTQLRVTLGSSEAATAQQVLWLCGDDAPALLLHPTHVPDGAEYTAQVRVLFANFTDDIFYSILDRSNVVFVDALVLNTTLRAPPRAVRSAREPRSWAWVHMFGDSVTRNLHNRVCEMLGFAVVSQERQQDEKQQTLRACCGLGKCISWEKFWYTPGSSRLPTTTLCSWNQTVYACAAGTHFLTIALKPDLLYISFGSHAPQANVSSTLVREYAGLLASSAYPVLLGLTTAVKESVFPAMHVPQLMTRNNLRIAAKNKFAATICAAQQFCHVVDLFSITFAAIDIPGAFLKGDPIHFTTSVQHIAASLVLDNFDYKDGFSLSPILTARFS
jgi:hypothetical protein